MIEALQWLAIYAEQKYKRNLQQLGARPEQRESQAQPIRKRFSPHKGFITDRTTSQFHQLSGWLVADDPAGEEAGCGGPRLAWLHVVRPVGRTAKLFKQCWRRLMVEE